MKAYKLMFNENSDTVRINSPAKDRRAKSLVCEAYKKLAKDAICKDLCPESIGARMKLKRIDKAMTTASITVEAAFIMPIIILTIFALIYLAFYLHDKSRIYNV